MSDIHENILLLLLIISLGVQLYFYVFIFGKFLFSKRHKTRNHICESPLSVIIAAKNEESNIRDFLPKVLNQDYPDFEVIVANDGSDDNTLQALKTLQDRYDKLRIINIENSKNGKKNALTKAINQAKHEFLIFTDADCYPASDLWLKNMSSGLRDNQIVLGYGAYLKTGGFWASFASYDSFVIALQYLTAAANGHPYMGVGRNLAYRKSLWEKHQGFEDHIDMISGDDDLFVMKASTSKNTAVVIDKESVTFSIPETSLSSLLTQKIRHISTSEKYNLKNLFFAGGEMFFRTFFYLGLVCFTIFGHYFIAIAMYSVKILIQYLVFNRFFQLVYGKNVGAGFIFFDIFAIIFYFLVYIFKKFAFFKLVKKKKSLK